MATKRRPSRVNEAGKQFVRQPKKVAQKIKKYR